MFLTQVNLIIPTKSFNQIEQFRSCRQSFAFAKKASVSALSTPYKRTKSALKHALSAVAIDKPVKRMSTFHFKSTMQDKWKKIVSIFQMVPVLCQQKSAEFNNLYLSLLKSQLTKHNFKFNLPETILIDEDSSMQLIYTKNGTINKKIIERSEVQAIMENGHQNMINALKKSNKYHIYSDRVDIKVNNNAPFAVQKQLKLKDKNRLSVESLRNFIENRWRVSTDKMLQRYIFSRNLKAMIFRITYEKAQRGQMHQQYTIHRFQNIANIFGSNSNNDYYNLRYKLSPTLNRPHTIDFSKIIGLGVMQKMMIPANQVKRLLQSVTKKKVTKLSVDMIQDLNGQLWVIGIKGVEYLDVHVILKKQQWLISSHVGYCRLCNGLFQKNQLRNSVSVRMLLQFLNHLKRRTIIQQQCNIEFFKIQSLNKRQNAMSAVCQSCYSLVIHQLQLRKCERILGRLCHIRMQDDNSCDLKEDGGQLRQWRLMVYLQQIKEVSNGVGLSENLIVRYTLGRGIQEKWKCSFEDDTIPVKKVKIHYFFSESQDIQQFLKNAQIVVTLLSSEGENVLAQGSTGILANFKNKFITQNGQRQTTTVLLFFQSGKYCELTLKVGLVYDGLYKTPQIQMRKYHSILLPCKDILNSNPLPKQWMQIFCFDQQIEPKDNHLSLISRKSQLLKQTKLKKKVTRYL